MKEKMNPDPCVAWFKEHEAELYEKYPGEWIAVDETGWFAHSSSAEELALLIEQEGRDDVFVIGIPEERTPAPFYGLAA